MALNPTYFSAQTSGKMEAGDVYIPLWPEASADLLDILSESGSYVYLTLQSDRAIETVKAYREADTVLVQRGIMGTTPVMHIFGTCVYTPSPTTLAVVLDLLGQPVN